MHYQHILLDWDGNIARTLDLWLDAIRAVLREKGYNPSNEEIAASFGTPGTYFQKLGIDNGHQVFVQADLIVKQQAGNVALYPDALEVLQYLKDIGKQTALITSNTRPNLDKLLERYNLYGLLDVIIANEDVKQHKPHPESLQKALALLGGTPQTALMIGDSDKDLGAAQNAGIDSVLFYPPEHVKFYKLSTLQQLKPTYTIHDFRKIKEIVS